MNTAMVDRRRDPSFKHLAVYLPVDVIARIKALSGYRGQTLSEAGQEAFEEWLNQYWDELQSPRQIGGKPE